MSDNDLQDEVNAVLCQFGDKIGIQNLKLDEDDNCQLSIDERMLVNVQLDSERGELVLFTVLGQLTDANRLEICETLLEANLFWNGTDGATVGLDRADGLLFLCNKTPLDRLILEHFETLLERFINTTEDWSGALGELQEASTQSIRKETIGAIRV